jgi:hypothetical protein
VRRAALGGRPEVLPPMRQSTGFAVDIFRVLQNLYGLTEWQKEKIFESLPKFKTIGDYLAKQDPSAELLTIYGIGKKRSAKIIDILDGFVDEFLS